MLKRRVSDGTLSSSFLQTQCPARLSPTLPSLSLTSLGLSSSGPNCGKFRASIHDNIAFGAPLPSPVEGAEPDAANQEAISRAVVSAARAANAHEFIMEAGGYEASVGEHGATLSGGQRQVSPPLPPPTP